ESREVISMPPHEVLEHIGELRGDERRFEREHPLDDSVGPRLVGRVEIARLGGGLERADDYARRVGTQVEGLTIQERVGCQSALPIVGGFYEFRARNASARAGCVW